jgi:putative membrane protein
MRHEFGMGWGGVAAVIIFVLFVIAVIGLVVWAARRGRVHHGMMIDQGPLAIAKERYAKGEISLAEFEEIKKNLS